MITEARGNLLEADVDALVNTVNTVGTMGKGLALQFKRAFPSMNADYERAVRAGEVQIGRMHVWRNDGLTGPRYVVNFPTKRHWRSPSRLADIEAGLVDLRRVISDLSIRSIAVPPLGCGNGGLDWATVEPLIRGSLSDLSDVNVMVYAPAPGPRAAEMPNRSRKPRMTLGRAALVGALDRYRAASLADASVVEVQKLLYFLQEAGEPLRLRYVAHTYGPYADNLRAVLREMEGHYLTGFGDGSAPVMQAEAIALLPGAVEAADNELAAHPDTQARIERVVDLVDGFESMYGLELLGSVHWCATHEAAGAPDPAIVEAVQSWTPRKGRLFTAEHVAAALGALRGRGWLPAPVPIG